MKERKPLMACRNQVVHVLDGAVWRIHLLVVGNIISHVNLSIYHQLSDSSSRVAEID